MNTSISIVAYTDAHHAMFRQLNVEWLDFYHLREEADMLVLNDPQGTILDRGGYIWIAEAGGEAVGSAALIREGKDVYELAKMAVTAAWRGRGISKLLIETCLAKAREICAKRLTLFSNHQLQTAIGLYEKYGFRHVAIHDSPFATADVMMELVL